MRYKLNLFCLLILLPSCNGGTENTDDFEFATGCRSTMQCASTLTCIDGACQNGSVPSGRYLLRIRPPADAIGGDSEIDGFEFESKPSLDLGNVKLPTPVEITGSAILPNGNRISVNVVATAQSSLRPRLSYHAETTDDVNGARFALRLPGVWPGENGTLQTVIYTLNALPTDKSLFPPWSVNPFQVPPEGGRVNLELPDTNDMLAITGVIYQDEMSTEPASGMRVFAVNADNVRISTEDTTDALGRFSLRFWPNVAGQSSTLKIRPTPASGPFPAADFQVDLPDGSTSEPLQPVSVSLNIDRRIELIDGQVVVDEPIAGAEVRFVGQVGNGRHRFDVRQTDSQGGFEALIYPGRYTVDIIPPMSSPYRITRLETVIDANAQVILKPRRRALVTGRVLDPAGNPIAGATITARLLKVAYADPRLERPNEVSPTRQQRTQSSQAGGYVLQLDPGRHELMVEAPAQLGLARLLREINVTPLDTDIPDTDLAIPAAGSVRLRLLDESQTAIDNSVVEIWQVVAGEPRRLATGVSEPNGLAQLRLPTNPDEAQPTN
ncbi:MAG: carboxypeptidase-like regulatory domain-containing protein [Bradymonadia bacterium]